MEGVRGAYPTCVLFWLFFSNISAGEALLAAYKFHAKLLFFAVFSFRVISHCSSVPMCLFRPKENVCLFRPEEDDVISVTSSTQSASLVIINLVLLHKHIH
jgi:hypothetical protein